MIKEKAMKDVTDLAGLEEFIGDYRHLRELESSMHEKDRLAVLCILGGSTAAVSVHLEGH